MMKTAVVVRDAREADMTFVQEIYAHHVRHGLASFEETAPTVAEMIGRRESVLKLDLPYLVAENWATFFLSVITAILALLGFGGDIFLIVVGITMLIVQINIARLIVTLAPLQIAIFLIAQLVAGSIGLLIVGLSLPVPPETAAAVLAQ